MTRAVIGSMLGIANDEVAVLIADNSENSEKHEFLRKIRGINPNIIAIAHKKNIGAQNNFSYLMEWCQDTEFCAIMADDDWMSPTYHIDAFQLLRNNSGTSCAEVGSTFVDMGDGKLVNVSQQAMLGLAPIERIRQWSAIAARATMYNASRRATLENAIQYLKTSPLHGLTLSEDLWELNRLALGDFIAQPGQGSFVHYPAHGSRIGDATQRYYDLLCKDLGLQYPFVFFTGLSTAIQCALFLTGSLSPLGDGNQKILCSQHVFSHIYLKSFLPMVSAESSHKAAAMLFASHPRALEGFLTFCNPPFSQNPIFNRAIVDWFIEIIKVFETKPLDDAPLLSEKFSHFVDKILAGVF